MLYSLLTFFALLAITFADPSKTIVENAAATPSLSTLVKVLSSPGYEPLLKALSDPGTFTVFAPNNKAFQEANIDPRNVDVVTQVLFYHLLGAEVKSTDLAALQFPNSLMVDKKFANLNGKGQVTGIAKTDKGVTINFGIPGVGQLTAEVVVADVICSNGIVHIIDKVLFFPHHVSHTAQNAGLTELVKALTKANLTAAVDTTPGLTIFAPTNDAMQAAKWETLDIATLTKVLTYHVVPAVAYSTDLTNGMTVKTLEGGSLTIDVSSSGVKVNDANVAVANALVENGVVHVIDKVLIPSSTF
jgi:uncharacterized surface protein with fasciclin (FAS1) repeats